MGEADRLFTDRRWRRMFVLACARAHAPTRALSFAGGEHSVVHSASSLSPRPLQRPGAGSAGEWVRGHRSACPSPRGYVVPGSPRTTRVKLPPLLHEWEGHLGFWRSRDSAPLGLPRGPKDGGLMGLSGLGSGRGLTLVPRQPL